MRRAPTATVLASIALLVPISGLARKRIASRSEQQLVAGAVAKPAGFKIRAPFPCGVTVKVNCSYGVRAHRRAAAITSTSDHYALDLSRVQDDNGFDRAVVAVAPGIVRYAGWTRGGWRPYGQVVYIEHGYRDLAGHRYQSLYAHLNRVTVARGERVRAGQPIGTLGGSSMGSRTKMGAHLHFALYQDAGSKGLGGGRAVLPEPMGYHRNLRGGKQFVACGRPEPVPVASLPPEPIRLPTDHRGLLAVGGLLPLE